MADPIHQFRIVKLFPIARIGNVDIAFTNSALFMVLAVVGICLFLLGRPDVARSFRTGPSRRPRCSTSLWPRPW